MRFFIAAVACLALTSAVRGQDMDMNDYMYELNDFDISGAITSKQSEKHDVQPKAIQSTPAPLPLQQTQKLQPTAPVQQQEEQVKIQAPLQQFTSPVAEKSSSESVEAISKSEPTIKPNTIMLQPILMMPKQRSKPLKTLNFNVDRAMAYRVSPEIEAENSRSVDIQFAPILNAKMRNILLTQQHQRRDEERLGFVETLPIQQKQLKKSKSARLGHKNIRAPLQQQFQGTTAFSGLNVGDENQQFQFLTENESLLSPQSYQFTQGENIDTDANINRLQQPIQRFTDKDVSASALTSSAVLLSELDETLPSVPLTHKNIISLGINQPNKLNQMIKSCIVNNIQSSPVCAKVISSAKLLVESPMASKVFDGIQL